MGAVVPIEMSRKVGSVVAVAALVVLAGVALPGTVGGAPAAPLDGETPSSAVPVVAVQSEDGGTNGTTNGTDGATGDGGSESTADAPLGTQLSSFMAASAADAENEVESGMFRAEWNRSNVSQRERLVGQRTGELVDRVAELREQREELLAAESLTPRERVQAAWLATQARGLERSVERMSEAANRSKVPVDRAALGELRRNARNLTEGEVSEMAPGLGVREDPGPPDDAGPPESREERGNGSDGRPEDPGPPDDGDDGDGGPPDNPGGGEGSGSGNDAPPGRDDSGDDGDDDSGDPGGSAGNGSGNGGGSGNGEGSGGSGNPGGTDDGEDGGSGNGDDPGRGNGEDPGRGNGEGSSGNGEDPERGNGEGSSGNGDDPERGNGDGPGRNNDESGDGDGGSGNGDDDSRKDL